jgi:hypothetical protein
MKRAIQSFAILLISLLAAGPASAALTCALGSSAMDSSHPMGMTQMAADCPMSQNLAAVDCSQDCCNRALPQGFVIAAVPARHRLIASVPAFFSVAQAISMGHRFASEPVSPAFAGSPPRYLLLRVFRI